MSSVSGKNVKKGIEAFSSAISSSVIVVNPLLKKDQNDFKQNGIFKKISNFSRNRFYLSQSESLFIDFKRKPFTDFAISRHIALQKAISSKDKVELMKILSYSLYEV